MDHILDVIEAVEDKETLILELCLHSAALRRTIGHTSMAIMDELVRYPADLLSSIVSYAILKNVLPRPSSSAINLAIRRLQSNEAYFVSSCFSSMFIL